MKNLFKIWGFNPFGLCKYRTRGSGLPKPILHVEGEERERCEEGISYRSVFHQPPVIWMILLNLFLVVGNVVAILICLILTLF